MIIKVEFSLRMLTLMMNANTGTEQIKTIYELDQLLSDFCLDSNKKNNTCRGFQFIL